MYGWIEVKSLWGYTENDARHHNEEWANSIWSGVFKISTLCLKDHNFPFFVYMEDKFSEEELELIEKRGLPPKFSIETENSLKECFELYKNENYKLLNEKQTQELEAYYKSFEWVTATWLTFEEINSIDWNKNKNIPSEYLIYQIMKLLVDYFGKDNVRLVLWPYSMY